MLIFLPFQLVGAYLHLICKQKCTTEWPVYYLHYAWVGNILSGQVRERSSTRKMPLYFADVSPVISTACELYSAVHQGGNHWVFVYINLRDKYLMYLDPKAPPVESERCKLYTHNWNVFSRAWNRESGHPALPENLKPYTMPHAAQGAQDNTNCGIYTLAVSNNKIFSLPH